MPHNHEFSVLAGCEESNGAYNELFERAEHVVSRIENLENDGRDAPDEAFLNHELREIGLAIELHIRCLCGRIAALVQHRDALEHAEEALSDKVPEVNGGLDPDDMTYGPPQ